MHEINANKRSRTIKLFILYFILAGFLSVATYVLVLAARGYDIDRSTGQVIQNGILLLESSPRNTTVYLNDQKEKKLAPNGYPVPEGTYDLRLERPGYRSWNNKATVVGSGINWLKQPLLIPDVISTTSVGRVDSLAFIEQSPDFSTLLSASEGSLTQLTRYDIDSNSVQPRSIALPNRLFDTDKDKIIGSLSFEQWSADGASVLFSYSSAKSKNQWLVVNLNTPATSWRFTGEYSEFVFADVDELYALNEKTVYQIVQDTPRLSVARQVIDIAYDGSEVWLLRSEDEEVTVVNIDTPTTAIINAGPDARGLMAARFESNSRITLIGADRVSIYGELNSLQVAENIPQKVIKLNGGSAELSSFSPEGRFFLASNGKKAVSYDLETQKTYSLPDSTISGLSWASQYQLTYNGPSDQIYVLDFDGSNAQQITGHDGRFGTFMNTNRRALFTIDTRSVGEGLTLRRSSLLSEQDR